MLNNFNTEKIKTNVRRFRYHSVWVPVSLSILFTACGTFGPQDGPPERAINADDIEDVVPKVEPLSKYGNPSSYVAAGKRYYVLENADGYVKRGTASWYGKKFHGQRTSNGEIYNMYAMSAAHKTLPLPSYLEVTNLDNQKSTIVRVNDRGPFHDDRLIDLSYAAAVKLGITGNGTAPVEIKTITLESPLSSTTENSAAPQHSPAQQDVSGHYIQVGAFADRYNAERMQKRISVNTPFPVTISNGGTDSPYYRVRIGPFSNSQELKAAEAQLSRLGINDTLVLSD